jgi:hypothetical protein
MVPKAGRGGRCDLASQEIAVPVHFCLFVHFCSVRNKKKFNVSLLQITKDHGKLAQVDRLTSFTKVLLGVTQNASSFFRFAFFRFR